VQEGRSTCAPEQRRTQRAVQPSVRTITILTVAVGVAIVGILDAVLGGHWDSAVLFAVVVAAIGTVVLTSRWNRPPVPLRGDLVAWLRRRSLESGEPVGVIADRAVQHYQLLVGGTGEGTLPASDRQSGDGG
jgi:hypothetical protein